MDAKLLRYWRAHHDRQVLVSPVYAAVRPDGSCIAWDADIKALAQECAGQRALIVKYQPVCYL